MTIASLWPEDVPPQPQSETMGWIMKKVGKVKSQSSYVW